MNRDGLIAELAHDLGTDRQHASKVLNTITDTIIRAVHRGESVTITGLGVFEQRRRAARTSRNPRTGEWKSKTATSVPAFRPGAQFKAVVSGAQPPPERKPAPNRIDPEVHDAVVAISEISRPRMTRPPKRLSAAQNKVIEQQAVDLVRRYFENRQYATTDVGATESYDVRAQRGDHVVKIEVKGTTSDGVEIVLTQNEVELHKIEHPNNALAIVKHIILDLSGPTATGGELELIMPWVVDRERLRPIAFRYQVRP